MTEQLTPVEIGRDRARFDGALKAGGAAPFAYDHPVEDPLYLWTVDSTIAKGRVAAVDASAAEATEGVVLVLTHDNAARVSHDDLEYAVLQDPVVRFRGQVVAAVVATTPEVARAAAESVVVRYDQEPHSVTVRAEDLYSPETVNAGFATDTDSGDLDAAMASAAVTVDESYVTARTHPSPMEPHTTVATWTDADGFVVFESSQSAHGFRRVFSDVFEVPAERVRVIAPFVGGGFGSKGMPHAGAIVAMMAARALPGRPVKFAHTRRQMFRLTGYRPRIEQRVRLAADADGTLLGVGVDVVQESSVVKEYAEQTAMPARTMYAAPNRRTSHRIAALDVPVPSWMRAPGETPGMFALESAIDELAHGCGIDPVELRALNEPAVDPDTGLPHSSRHLVRCLRAGADLFGWYHRDPRVRSRRQGPWLVGQGVAASTYPAYRQPNNTALVRFAHGRYQVEIAAADIGTGAWTVLNQIAADALGVPVEEVDLAIGDSALPVASVAGGSSGTASWGTAIVTAARQFREKFGADPGEDDEVRADIPAHTAPGEFAPHAHGAQFAEVHVHEDTGEIRVPRLYGVFDAGQVINPRTARSQLVGGMVMGMSMALHEDSVMDTALGHTANPDLADYHIPVNADVCDLRAEWLGVPDYRLNPMGSKGIGEIGITGTAAAIANAAFHATGVRVRELPITLDKFLR
ncbi:xanthine dehydrogenase family protein molybdopterin-binding subunit [Actinokineospora sp. G85]|uniref:xanthine dehydrogenase family protein molybdopterin-binding subunit n=1 Tax=Actinokineospora sp. G85 TaxID=3406626 RepID=UPI003C70B25C